MISTAHHGNRSNLMFRASLRKRAGNFCSTLRWRVCIHKFLSDRNLPFRGNALPRFLNHLQHRVAPLQTCIPQIQSEFHLARNTIHRAGKHIADARSRHGIDRPASARRIFNGQNQLRRGAQGISSLRHQYSPSVPARAFDHQTKTRRSRNAGNNPKRNFLAFEQRTLLDVQLHKRFVVSIGEFYFFKRTAKACVAPDFVQRSAFFVHQLARRISRHGARKQPAAQTSDSKTRRFLRSEKEELDGMFRTESAALQRANRFQSSQHAHDAVIFPGIRYRIDVRAGSHRRSARLRAVPSRKGISDGIVAQYQPGLLAKAGEPLTRFPIRRRKNNACDPGRFGIRDQRELFNFRVKTISIHLQIHFRVSAGGAEESGCRFQSLYMRYFAGTLPIAPNHCGHHGAIQIKSPAVTGYHESPRRYIPPPSSMSKPCSMMCISTWLSAAPGWYTMELTAKSNWIESGSRSFTRRLESSPRACEDTASSLEMIAPGG